MSHLMTDGRPCGRPDGHSGCHLSLEVVEKERTRKRVYPEAHPDQRQTTQNRYRQSPKGILAQRRQNRRQQLARFSALMGYEVTLEAAKEMFGID